MNQSIVPVRRVRDPRQLLFHYPSIPVVRYSQMAADFYQDQMLRMAEELAARQGFILVPACCLSWRKKQEIAAERQVSIGKHSYYMMRRDEMTKRAQEKLKAYIEQLQEDVS
ncbi:hypothetical protein ABEO98_21655 [Brevibacillus parabrevis]|uniref:hypothetical protein n=1 Tax=Brevibacillus parabrevis TaxID=54914 RepID=UPI002E24E8B0|nr:hypothetical protein [Brevibacillus parabrevis]